MKLFFDSSGKFIASEEGGRLHSSAGGNIGHYRGGERIFIDLSGRYLGEVVLGNRLMDNLGSKFREVGFAVPGIYGGVGSIGNPGSAGVVAPVAGYVDVPAERLDS